MVKLLMMGSNKSYDVNMIYVLIDGSIVSKLVPQDGMEFMYYNKVEQNGTDLLIQY